MAMSDEHPPPDDAHGAPEPADQHGASGPLDDEIVARLHALDHLYQSHEISAAELAEARAEVLSGVEHPHRYHSEAPPPPPPSPPSAPEPAPPAGDGGEGGGDGQKRILGLPVGVAAAIGAFIVVGAIAVILALVLSGGDDGTSGGTTTQTTETTAGEYPQGVTRATLDQLNSSAVAIGTALAQTSEPARIAALRRSAERQIALVEQARRRLSEVAVSEADRPAQEKLIAATAAHRRYLVQLVRATTGIPSEANLAAIDRVRQAGAEMRRAYAAFFALAPAAPDAVTGTDLTDTAGLRSAIQQAIAEREAEEEAQTTTTIITVPDTPDSPDEIYGGSTFQSPTGNLHCQDQGAQLFCSSSNDNFAVFLPQSGPPVTGNGVAPGGGVLPYGALWSSGAFTCASETSGITCRNLSGDGFFLSRDEYRAL
jgi:hypothetical protein